MERRIRSKSSDAAGGFQNSLATGYQDEIGYYSSSQARMVDYTKKTIIRDEGIRKGLLPSSEMDNLKYKNYYPATVSYISEGGGQILRGWPCRHDFGYSAPDSSIPGFEPVDQSHVATLLSRTNPFRFGVSVPVMVSELGELATLFKLVTKSYASLLGSGYLSYQFGILPFASDLQQLFNIMEALQSRVREFNALIEQGYVRRRVPISSGGYSDILGNSSNPDNEHSIYSGPLGFTVSAKVQRSWSVKTWASCKWAVRQGATLPTTQLDDFLSAFKYFLDLDQGFLGDTREGILDMSTAWEAIPFSWLVDYFVNIGDILRSIEENETVYPLDICVMREITLNHSIEPVARDWWPTHGRGVSATPGRESYLHQHRTVFNDDPSVADLLSFGFMNMNQAKNVIALLAVITARKKQVT